MAAAPGATSQLARRPAARLVQQPVLAVLVAGLLAALLGMPFLSVAPHRLVTGQGEWLWALPTGAGWGLVALVAGLGMAACTPARGWRQAVSAAAAALLLVGIVAVAGIASAQRAAQLPALARVSLGGGFWLALLLAWATLADALPRVLSGSPRQAAAHAGVVLALGFLLGSGLLDALSLLKEYANRQDVFWSQWWRHLQIVGIALAAAALLGVPLGLAASRHERVARPLFAALNLIQTVPSMALFGLLIGPLAWWGQAMPGWGVQGIGLLPAVIALALYSLLPIAHGVVAGLQQVPAAALEAATGMGMSQRQRLWQVELPLALPVLLAALRLTAVQLVGLAVVAALIGAGGLGAIVFQGLLGSALDMVLLGVLPVVLLALLTDAAFRLLTLAVTRRAP